MWTTADIPSQQQRVAVVTGANTGLGFEVASALAVAGATVVMAVRDTDRARDARERITSAYPDAAIDVQALDLASLASVRAGADAIMRQHRQIDLLVNNAGVMGIPEQATVDGFEMQLAVNHFGHFVLTRRLLPSLLDAPSGRVVSVTSFARFIARVVDASNPHLNGRYGPWRAYGQAKYANVLFAVELHRRLVAAGASVASLVAHPGLSHTGLQERSVAETGGGVTQRFWQAAARRIGSPQASAARSVLRAATDLRAKGGQLYGPRWFTFGAAVRRPLVRPMRRAAETLWEVSERETGELFEVPTLIEGA